MRDSALLLFLCRCTLMQNVTPPNPQKREREGSKLKQKRPVPLFFLKCCCPALSCQFEGPHSKVFMHLPLRHNGR